MRAIPCNLRAGTRNVGIRIIRVVARRALLGQTGLYDQWFLGGHGIPYWAGFTIGYDIVADYHQRHPDASWSAITAASAPTILAGSHYQPCSS